MKYLLIFLLSFAFINPALAAKTVSGAVPKLQPLQPPPAGITPNYSKNIQYQDPNYVPTAGSSNTGPGSQGQLPGQSPVSGQSQAAALVQNSSAHHYVWWAALLLAAALLGYLVYKRNKAK